MFRKVLRQILSILLLRLPFKEAAYNSDLLMIAARVGRKIRWNPETEQLRLRKLSETRGHRDSSVNLVKGMSFREFEIFAKQHERLTVSFAFGPLK